MLEKWPYSEMSRGRSSTLPSITSHTLWAAPCVGLSVVVGTTTMGMLVCGLDAGSADCQALP